MCDRFPLIAASGSMLLATVLATLAWLVDGPPWLAVLVPLAFLVNAGIATFNVFAMHWRAEAWAAQAGRLKIFQPDPEQRA